MAISKIQKLTVALLLLVLVCQSVHLQDTPAPITVTPITGDPASQPAAGTTAANNADTPKPATDTPKKSTHPAKKNKDEDDQWAAFIILPFFGGQSKLTTLDVTKLNDTQKEVDKFIRDNSKVGNANLTQAQSDGDSFVYTYQNKTENKTQTWIISACTCKQDAKPADTKSTDTSSTDTSKPASKYTITGVNYVEYAKPSEEDQKKMEEAFKKQSQKWDQWQKEFEQSMNNLGSSFDDWF